MVSEKAADIRAKYSFKTPDAIHLASAMYHNCFEFLTNDKRLLNISCDLKMVIV